MAPTEARGYPQDSRPLHLWSIVLSGGDGRRLAPMIKHWLGHERPKQYCTFTGTRSMLQHTVDRADGLTDPERRVTVIAADHGDEATRQLRNRGGRLVVQPKNCDTAPGVFLPLTYVRAFDPAATVVILPSDHFVHPEDRFLDAVRHAALAVDLLPERILLVGLRPEGRELDYGYIRVDRQLGTYGGHPLWTVGRFIEKPGSQAARVLDGDDLLWSTMIVVAKVERLWELGWQILPSMMRLFDTLQPAIGLPEEPRLLRSLYERMPVRSFSTDILEQAPHRLAALDLQGVRWSDWGRPERIVESLRQLGKAPIFPSDLVGVA